MRVWFNRTFSSVHAAIGLIREADVAGEFHIIYSNSNPHAAAGQAAHEFILEPTGLSDAEYVDWCLAFCREHRVDVFWPGRAASLLSGQAERFLVHGTRILSVASSEVLNLLHDKARFYASVKLPEAPPAQCHVFQNIAQFDEAHALLRPLHATLCVKPSQSVYGLGFGVLDEERNCAQLLIDGVQYRVGLQDFRRGLAEQGECRPMLLMEYLDGQEYSVDCVADHGRLICAVPRRKSLKAGRGQVIDMRADIIEATARLAADYRLNAVFNVQFKEGGGMLRLLEINPRMSGGIGMACQAGPPLPYIALAGFVHGHDTLDVPLVRAGIRVAEYPRTMELT